MANVLHRVIRLHYPLNFTVYLNFSLYKNHLQNTIPEGGGNKSFSVGTLLTWGAGPLSGDFAALQFLLLLLFQDVDM